jgi:hypothetical protein
MTTAMGKLWWIGFVSLILASNLFFAFMIIGHLVLLIIALLLFAFSFTTLSLNKKRWEEKKVV